MRVQTRMTEYHRLGRNGGSLTQRTKSVTCFLTLLVLSFTGFLFYLYLSATFDLRALRAEYDDQNTQNTKIRNELLDINSKLEKAQNSDRDCKATVNTLNTKIHGCDTELIALKAAAKNSDFTGKENDATIKQLQEKISYANQALEKQKQNCSSLVLAGTDQSELVRKLDQKILTLESELAKFSKKLPVVVNDKIIRSAPNGTLTRVPSTGSKVPTIGELADNKTDIVTKEEEDLKVMGVAPPPPQQNQEESINSNKAKESSLLKGKEREVDEEDEKAIVFKRPPLEDAAHEDANDENGGADDMHDGHGDFIARRRTGGRVALEEANARRERLEQRTGAGESPLLKVVAAQHQNEKDVETIDNAAELNDHDHPPDQQEQVDAPQ